VIELKERLVICGHELSIRKEIFIIIYPRHDRGIQWNTYRQRGLSNGVNTNNLEWPWRSFQILQSFLDPIYLII